MTGRLSTSTTIDAAAVRRLRVIRLLHTLVWAGFVGAIIAIPVATGSDRLRLALGLSLLIWGEVAVLAFNRWRCPLTGVAARYTANRAYNFDIYLPIWLARWNKAIFGGLFAAIQLWLAWRMLG